MGRHLRIKFQPSQSLRVRITVSSLLVFLAGVWVLQAYIGQMLRADMQRILGEQQFSTVSVLAGQVNQEIDARFKVLESVASAAAPHSPGSAAAMQALLAERPGLISLFNRGVFVTGLDGIAIASYPESMGRMGLSFVDRDYIQAALVQGKATVSRAVIGRPQGTPVINMATPIRNPQGQVVGVMAGVIDLEEPSFLQVIMQSPYGKTGGFFLVSRQHRMIVTATDKSRVMQPLPPEGVNPEIDRLMRGFEGTVLLTNQLGEKVLSSGKQVPLAGWDMVASLPTREAFAPIKAMRERMLLATSLMSLLVATLTWWLLSWHLRPLSSTIKSLAGRRQPDELLAPLPTGPSDEVGQMIVAFNRLLEILRRQDTDLRLSEQALQSISEAVVITDAKHVVLSVNAAYERLSGYSTLEITGRNLRLLQGHQTDVHTVSAIRDALQRQVPFVGEILNYRKDGKPFWNDLSITPAFDAQGNVNHFVGVTRDITEQKRARRLLEDSNALNASVLNSVDSHVAVLDAHGRIVAVNAAWRAFARDNGSPDLAANSIGLNYLEVCEAANLHDSGEEALAAAEGLRAVLALSVEHFELEYPCHSPTEQRWFQMTVTRLAGNTPGVVVNHKNITSIRHMEEQVRHMAYFDVLTSLPNRRLLIDRLMQALISSQRSKTLGALVFLDLDNFKPLNDHAGHAAGDLLLAEVAQRLKACVRGVDTVARFGGDEFVVLLVDLPSDRAEAKAHALSIAEKIRASLAEPYTLSLEPRRSSDAADAMPSVVEHRCTVSMGLTLFGDRETNPQEVIHRADAAMYRAKHEGRNRVIFDYAD